MSGDSTGADDRVVNREEKNRSWQTPGLCLRKARKEKGLSVEEVCHRLALTQRAVKALEADDYSKLPSELYIRGYIRRYCSLLELQEQTVLGYFEAHCREQEADDVRTAVIGPELGGGSRKGLWIAGGVALLLAVLIIGLVVR